MAEEVRNLAARSAKAGKKTTDMLEGSIGKVNEETKIVNQTAEESALHQQVNSLVHRRNS